MQHSTYTPFDFSKMESPEDIIAFHRVAFGGFRMEDEPPADQPPADEPPADEPPADEPPADEPPADEPPADEDGDEGTTLDLDGAKQALKKVRGEAASLRVKNKELVKALSEAKTPEDIQALIADAVKDAASSEHTLVVENVALKHKLTDELAQVLADASAGKTREEMEAHAKTLAKYLPTEDADRDIDPDDLNGGLDPSDDEAPFDAVKLAKKIRSSRYR